MCQVHQPKFGWENDASWSVKMVSILRSCGLCIVKGLKETCSILCSSGKIDDGLSSHHCSHSQHWKLYFQVFAHFAAALELQNEVQGQMKWRTNSQYSKLFKINSEIFFSIIECWSLDSLLRMRISRRYALNSRCAVQGRKLCQSYEIITFEAVGNEV